MVSVMYDECDIRVLPTLVGFGVNHLSLQNYHHCSQFNNTNFTPKFWSNFYHLSNFLGITL